MLPRLIPLPIFLTNSIEERSASLFVSSPSLPSSAAAVVDALVSVEDDFFPHAVAATAIDTISITASSAVKILLNFNVFMKPSFDLS